MGSSQVKLEENKVLEAIFIESDDKSIHNNEPNVGVHTLSNIIEYNTLTDHDKTEKNVLPLILGYIN